MSIGLVYNIIENYDFENIDSSLSNFETMRNITFLKNTLELFGHNIMLIKSTDKSDLLLQANAKYDCILFYNNNTVE